jgi:hypothetical protein
MTGRWTREEHQAFIKGLELYGKGQNHMTICMLRYGKAALVFRNILKYNAYGVWLVSSTLMLQYLAHVLTLRFVQFTCVFTHHAHRLEEDRKPN